MLSTYPSDEQIQMFFDEIFGLFARYDHPSELEANLNARIVADREELAQYHFADPVFEDMFREVFLHENPIALILITHLYVEKICDRLVHKILPKASEAFKGRKDITFSLKFDIIRASGKVPSDILNDIKVVNVLRNHTAHNLDSSIEDFDFSRFTFCKEIYYKTQMVEHTVKWELHMHLLRYIAYFVPVRLARDTRLIKSLKGRRKAALREKDDIPL